MTPRTRYRVDDAGDVHEEVLHKPEPEPAETEAERKKRERAEKDEHPGLYL